MGSTGTVPTRLGECEHVTAGVSFTGEHAVATWDRAGNVVAHPQPDQGIIGSFGMGVRLNRQLSITANLPVRLSHRGHGASSWGGGIGDASALLLVDPLEERPKGPPVPIFMLGVRAPTGVDWTESKSPQAADITGLPGVSVNLTAQLERTLNKTPYTLSFTGGVPFGAPVMRPTFTVSGTVGRYLGTSWSVLGGLRHQMNGLGTDRSHRTVVSARIVHGRPLSYRFYASLESDVPSPFLGRSNPLFVRGSVGGVWVH